MIPDHAHENSCHGQPKHAPQDTPLDLETVRQRLAESKGPAFWRSLEELSQDARFLDMVHREFPRQASEWIGDKTSNGVSPALAGWMDEGTSRRNFLKLSTASLALAGLTACTRQPLERIVPYVKQPEEIVPGRPLFFATAVANAGFAQGVLVESHLGRPTKVEGNPDHPWSLGATDLYAQASILSLYDPDRSQTVTYLGRVQSWDNLLASIQPTLDAEAATGGSGIRLLSGAVTSPTLAAQIQAFLANRPQARWHQWESAGRDTVKAGGRLAYGAAVETHYDLSKADVVLTLESDLLTAGPGAVRYARQFSDRRRVPNEGSDNASMNRLYTVESTPTLTGTMADHRLSRAPHAVNAFALGLAQAVGVAGSAATTLDEKASGFLAAAAKDLLAHRGRSLVVAGEQAPAELHALVHAINQALGNVGATALVTEAIEVETPTTGATAADSLRALVDDLNGGKVKLLVILGTNPVYDAPVDLKFTEALDKAGQRIHVGLYVDETAEHCEWQVPEAHSLETWSDARAIDGTASIQQPLIEPLYGGKSHAEVVAALNGEKATAMDLVKATWMGRGLDEAAWRKALHDGMVGGSVAAASGSGTGAGVAQAVAKLQTASSDPGFTVLFRPDPTLHDGRWANSGWLQECPKPLTKLTWDNALLVAAKTAQELGVEHQDVVELQANGRSLKVPVWVLPGHAQGCATLHLGHGRTRAGRVGDGVGTNVGPFRGSDALWSVAGVTVKKTGETYRMSSTQMHYNIFDGEGKQAANRHLIRTVDLKELVANPHAIQEMEHQPDPKLNLYPGFEYTGYAWGLAVDLNSCTGCNACVVACQSENNIPVVGKEMVDRGREMHWIRIDRYYAGDLDDPSVFHQPLMCMQCEQAPCEGVCPVAATTHSTEGLNDMVYNRCVGTRYCANNCPYKVRRFNYLYWNGNTYNDVKSHPVMDLMKNPDVTVRSRGVMEKCTYCVQRINRARIMARVEDRQIRDGEIKTACQQACPAQAISFGDINDKSTQVARWKASTRNYGLLEELNTKPRTTYLGRITNKNPELESA
jgi:MoCo/4Fe-4S cofactor protein with predicted Tat translocation signal